MIYERLPSLPFPHGAEPLLADSVDFLEVASLAGTIPSALDYRYPKKDLQRSQMLYDSILPELEQPNFLATRDREGTIVGTAAYHINPERRFMHLDILAVDPQYRKQHIGSELLRLAIAHGLEQGAESITLTSSPEAYEFYIAHGFDDVEEDDDSEIRDMAKILIR